MSPKSSFKSRKDDIIVVIWLIYIYSQIEQNSLKIGQNHENDQISKKSNFTNFRDMMKRFGLDENTSIGVLLDTLS